MASTLAGAVDQRKQLVLLYQRARGRFRFGRARGFALLSLVRWLPWVTLAFILWFSARFAATTWFTSDLSTASRIQQVDSIAQSYRWPNVLRLIDHSQGRQHVRKLLRDERHSDALHIVLGLAKIEAVEPTSVVADDLINGDIRPRLAEAMTSAAEPDHRVKAACLLGLDSGYTAAPDQRTWKAVSRALSEYVAASSQELDGTASLLLPFSTQLAGALIDHLIGSNPETLPATHRQAAASLLLRFGTPADAFRYLLTLRRGTDFRDYLKKAQETSFQEGDLRSVSAPSSGENIEEANYIVAQWMLTKEPEKLLKGLREDPFRDVTSNSEGLMPTKIQGGEVDDRSWLIERVGAILHPREILDLIKEPLAKDWPERPLCARCRARTER